MTSNRTWQKVIPLILFIVLCVFSVIRSVSELKLSPDSSSYITAAQNLIRTGQVFVYTNYPSESMEPSTEPYTEQPVGFPLYLVFFLLVLKQPYVAAAAAQALSIVMLYGAVWALTRDFRVEPGFQLACGLAVTLFRPLTFVYTYLWSETLFTALTLWVIHFLLIARVSRKPRISLLLALGLATAATATRSIGILTLGIFIVAAWHQSTILHSKKSSLAWIGLSFLFTLGPLAAWSLRNQILYGSISMTHIVQTGFNFTSLLQPFNYLLDMAGSIPFTRLLIAGFSLLCMISPFLVPGRFGMGDWRFKTDFTKIRFSTLVLGLFGIVLITSGLTADQFGFGGPPGIGLKQSAMIYLGILCMLAAWLGNINFLEGVRVWKAHYDWSWWQSQFGYGYLLLLVGGLCHFLGIIVLSQVTPFSTLEDRLLVPSLTLLLLAVLMGLYQLADLGRKPRFALGVYTVAFVLAVASPAVVKENIIFRPGFHFPPEQQLWQELSTYPGISQVSHFYTDTNFTHQIYARRPQRVISFVDSLNQGGYLDSLMSKGTCPFVLVNAGDPMSELMLQVYQGSGLTRYVLMDGRFELYARDCLFLP
jgi:hypothetical protein